MGEILHKSLSQLLLRMTQTYTTKKAFHTCSAHCTSIPPFLDNLIGHHSIWLALRELLLKEVKKTQRDHLSHPQNLNLRLVATLVRIISAYFSVIQFPTYQCMCTHHTHAQLEHTGSVIFKKAH
jgi:hypothetical protein